MRRRHDAARRGRGAVAVDQHRQWSRIDLFGIRVTLDLDLAGRIADLDHRALFDEQPGQFGRLRQGTTAVAAQIDDDPVDPRGLELLEQQPHVPGRALEITLAGGLGIEIAVEGRDLDHAEPYPAIEFDDLALGRLVFEFYLVAHQFDDLRATAHALTLGQDTETHDAVFRPADQVDDILQAPADHVFHIAVVTLRNADDAITAVELAAALGRAAGHRALDLGEFVVVAQHGADTL